MKSTIPWISCKEMAGGDTDHVPPLLARLADLSCLCYIDKRLNCHYLHWTLITISASHLGATSSHEMWWATEAVEQYGEILRDDERARRMQLFQSCTDGLTVDLPFSSRINIVRCQGERPEVVIYEHTAHGDTEVFRTNTLMYGYK
jgi:hypothetical protein